MTGNRLLAPVTAALNILEEYHKDVEKRLKSLKFEDDARNQIVTDIYAKDDIYFSLNRSYEHIEISFADFCRRQGLHSSLPERFPEFRERSLYKHQAQAIQSIQKEQTTIISTGTGSGKTESFLIPILQHCLVEKEKGVPGIKAVLLYPLNALANDQIRRIIKAVKGTGIRVGCFVRSTPTWKERVSNDPQEQCVSRREMIDAPPDILITNYVMLDRLITRPEDSSMFLRSAKSLKYIVVDEVHYFRGTRGANLSLLLRRFRLLCEQSLIQIGASGTLRRGGGYFPDSKQDSIEQFARLIFGNEAVTRKGFQLIEPVFFESVKVLEPLPITDTIEGDSFLCNLDKTAAERLYEQLSGKVLEKKYAKDADFSKNVLYLFALRSPFIAAMYEQLEQLGGGSCTFNDFVKLFRKLYRDVHGKDKEPRNPRMVVEAYWSLINYLNHRCGENHTPLILDYRLHIILGNVGDELTRCLLCKRYHDGRCPRCRHCSNGLLFKVSQERPDLCVAFLAGQELFPEPPLGRRHFPVLAGITHSQIQTDGAFTRLGLEPHLDTTTEEESYMLRPAYDNEEGIVIQISSGKQDRGTLTLSEPRMYWHNVMKVVDALVVNPEKKITDKLLGFIDNRERASAIKLRLNDEIADRTLSSWARGQWSNAEPMNVVEAFHVLKNAMPLALSSDEEDEARNGPLREMPFWFARMLSWLEEYEEWKVSINTILDLQPEEFELLTIMLRECAIDRTNFYSHNTPAPNHFHLEKDRVNTQYGIGLSSTDEQGYDITSLGEHGILYKEFIKRVQSINIRAMLDSLTSRGIIIQKQTPREIPFYQLRPEH